MLTMISQMTVNDLFWVTVGYQVLAHWLTPFAVSS